MKSWHHATPSWDDEPVLTTVAVQVGEAPVAYRAVWEVREDGEYSHGNLIEVTRRDDEPQPGGLFARGEFRRGGVYPTHDAPAAAALTRAGRAALAKFGIPAERVDEVGVAAFAG